MKKSKMLTDKPEYKDKVYMNEDLTPGVGVLTYIGYTHTYRHFATQISACIAVFTM